MYCGWECPVWCSLCQPADEYLPGGWDLRREVAGGLQASPLPGAADQAVQVSPLHRARPLSLRPGQHPQVAGGRTQHILVQLSYIGKLTSINTFQCQLLDMFRQTFLQNWVEQEGKCQTLKYLYCRSEISLTDMRRDSNYIIFYVCWFWAIITGAKVYILITVNLFLKGLIPFLILSVLSFKIHRSMKRLRERLARSNKYAE